MTKRIIALVVGILAIGGLMAISEPVDPNAPPRTTTTTEFYLFGS